MAENTARVKEKDQEPGAMDATALLNRPCYRVYTHWTDVEGKKLEPGVYWHYSDRKTGDPRTLRICDYLETVMQMQERETGVFSMKLRFQTVAGKKEIFMDQGMLSGRGGPLCEELFSKGLRINKTGGEEHVVKYLSEAVRQAHLVDTVCKPGWHGDSFLLPGRTFGPQDVTMSHRIEAESVFSKAGTLEEWQQNAAAYCQGNPAMILAVSTAFGSMLLKRLGVNGGGFHFKGDSSTGKTLLLLLACSVLGSPRMGGYLASWNTTQNGLEILAEGRNDLPLILDELKQAKPHAIQEMVYMLANGQGKGRMDRDRGQEAAKTWRVLVLSSGEKSLAEHAALSGDPANAGAELRMADIDAESRKYKAFDEIHGCKDGDAFWKLVNANILDNHGTSGPAFLEKLCADKDRDFIREFSAIRNHFNVTNSQAGRVADRFAVAAFGGELAIEYGVVPWQQGVALEACVTLYQEWVATQGKGSIEDRQILTQLSDFLDAYGDTKFSDVSFGADRTSGPRAGYYELVGDSRVYHFNKAGIKDAVRGYGVDRVLQALDIVGALKRNSPGKNQNQIRIRNGGRPWFYTIVPEKLTETTQDEE